MTRFLDARSFDTFGKPFKIDEYFPSQAPVVVWRLIQCRSGGIGRRAWFRSMYSQGCGGSSPFFGTSYFVSLHQSDSSSRFRLTLIPWRDHDLGRQKYPASARCGGRQNSSPDFLQRVLTGFLCFGPAGFHSLGNTSPASFAHLASLALSGG